MRVPSGVPLAGLWAAAWNPEAASAAWTPEAATARRILTARQHLVGTPSDSRPV